MLPAIPVLAAPESRVKISPFNGMGIILGREKEG